QAASTATSIGRSARRIAAERVMGGSPDARSGGGKLGTRRSAGTARALDHGNPAPPVPIATPPKLPSPRSSRPTSPREGTMKSPRRTAPAPARATSPSPGQRLLRNLHLLRALVAATLEEGGLPPEHGISVVQMSVLRLVAARHGTPTALGEIARRLEVSVPAASKAIARLVASGHLRARADRADARRLRVDVTDAGENAIRRFEAARERRADALVARAGAATAERW